MDKIQIDLDREDHFHPEIQKLSRKQFSQKFYYILATEKLSDSFVEVERFLMNRYII